MRSLKSLLASNHRLFSLLILMLIISGAALGAQAGSAALQRNAMSMLINVMVVVGLYVFVGNSGVFSFGHLSFMAIGGYTAAILALESSDKARLFPALLPVLKQVHVHPVAAVVVGGVVSALFALVLSGPLMRLSGLNAGLATFAVLIIINNVARNWSQVTNAASGISGLPDALFGVTLVAALVVVAIAWIFQQTATCLRLRGVRDDELAAASVGIHISKVRSAAFVLSAFLVGIGGGLFGQVQGAVTPDAFFLQPTFLAIAMLVVGGIGSLSGAVIGVLVITIMRELFTRLELGVTIGSFEVRAPFGVGNLAISIMMLAILIKRPVGLLAGRELLDPLGSSAPKSSGGHRRPAIEDSVNA